MRLFILFAFCFNSLIFAEEKPEILKDMIFIPAGEFLIGSDNKKVYVDSYYIDKYEVTNEQYAKFLNEWGKTTDENGNEMIRLEGSFRFEKTKIFKQGNKFDVQSGYEKYPVQYVSWYGANQYAKWIGKGLPTEAEWQKAARGTDGRKFPWGNKFDRKKGNFDERYDGPTPVGKFPAGASPYGVMDMAGNVAEWCSDWFDDKEVFKVRCGGGSWNWLYAECYYVYIRDNDLPSSRYDHVGFRCAYNEKK